MRESIIFALMTMLRPDAWSDYRLIDSGDFEKLEQFGPYVLCRPEPQALWPKSLAQQEWDHLAHARFDREQKDKFRFSDDVNGGWIKRRKMPDSWHIHYRHGQIQLTLRLALTSFGHVGLFPEQACNWNFIDEQVRSWRPGGKVLNLFAYTGAASMVARAAGAEVTHVDASRPGLNWANQNMQLNNLTDIRWVYEDALKFVKREVKRGNQYQGIIMDPPPYGRGPQGEKWTLQEKLNELVEAAGVLLSPDPGFFILNMYAAGLSSVVGGNVVQQHFNRSRIESGEFLLRDDRSKDLPMGTYARLTR